MPFVGAAVCRRAAVLTTSPDAMPSPASGRAPSATRASPVVIPMRTSSSPASAKVSRMESAARTARSGSSSCATGAPNTAITASPMNFSTVPPNRSSSERTRGVVGLEHAPHVLGVHTLCARGEADEVAEEAGDDLALLALRPYGERRRAPGAEAGVVCVLAPAAGAELHAGRIGARMLVWHRRAPSGLANPGTSAGAVCGIVRRGRTAGSHLVRRRAGGRRG